MDNLQTKEKKQRYHWIVKAIITVISAVVGALAGGLVGMFMLMIVWGWLDSSTVAIIQGPPVGFLVGGITAFMLMQKEKTVEKIIFIPIPLAIILSCIVVAILNLNYL